MIRSRAVVLAHVALVLLVLPSSAGVAAVCDAAPAWVGSGSVSDSGSAGHVPLDAPSLRGEWVDGAHSWIPPVGGESGSTDESEDDAFAHRTRCSIRASVPAFALGGDFCAPAPVTSSSPRSPPAR